MSRQKLLFLPAAALALSSCGWFHSGNGNAIRLSGNIELTQVNISFKIAGRLIERAVNEGDPVKKGMVVARLDKEQLLAQRDRAKAALESLLVQQRTSIEWQDETLEAQIQQRQAEVRNADARLAELLAGSRTQEKEQARAAVERAQTEYDRSAADWKRAQTLFKNEDISAADYDQYRTRYETADAQLKSAKEQLALVLEGPRRETIAQAQAMLGQTRGALRQAEAQERPGHFLKIKRKVLRPHCAGMLGEPARGPQAGGHDAPREVHGGLVVYQRHVALLVDQLRRASRRRADAFHGAPNAFAKRALERTIEISRRALQLNLVGDDVVRLPSLDAADREHDGFLRVHGTRHDGLQAGHDPGRGQHRVNHEVRKCRVPSPSAHRDEERIRRRH